jgi:hypothetical protein
MSEESRTVPTCWSIASLAVYTLEVAPPADWAANFQTDVQLAAGSDVLLRDHRTVVGSSAFGGRVVTLGQSNPGTALPSKSGISFATFRLAGLDAATGAAEIAKLGAR